MRPIASLAPCIAVPALAALCACEGGAARTGGDIRGDSFPGMPATPSTGSHALPPWSEPDTVGVVADTWTVRDLLHAPEYLRLVAWKDDRTLWGVAGCNPVEVSVDADDVLAWDVRACGGVAPAPDGRTIAWGSGDGEVRVGERGSAGRVLRTSAAPAPGGEGDPSGTMLWSPDGASLLLAWATEWESTYAVVAASTGAERPIRTRAEGYFLTEPWGWLDETRILFSAQATRDLQGRSEYSESGGSRGDLMVFDLADSTYTRVTAAPDGVLLRALARWSDAEILVGERDRGAHRHRRYWLYHVLDWSRQPLALPAAADLRVHAEGRVLLLDVAQPQGGPPLTRVYLWSGADRPVVPLIELRGGDLVWSPDGRRVAVTTTVDEPVPSMPRSFRTRHRTRLLERR